MLFPIFVFWLQGTRLAEGRKSNRYGKERKSDEKREREREKKKANDKPEPRIAAENLAFPIAIDSSGIGRSVAQCSKPKDWTGPGERERQRCCTCAEGVGNNRLRIGVLRTPYCSALYFSPIVPVQSMGRSCQREPTTRYRVLIVPCPALCTEYRGGGWWWTLPRTPTSTTMHALNTLQSLNHAFSLSPRESIGGFSEK